MLNQCVKLKYFITMEGSTEEEKRSSDLHTALTLQTAQMCQGIQVLCQMFRIIFLLSAATAATLFLADPILFLATYYSVLH